MDLVLFRISENSGCRLSSGAVRITDLSFHDDAVIFTETTEVLAEALESLSAEAEAIFRFRTIHYKEVRLYGEVWYARFNYGKFSFRATFYS